MIEILSLLGIGVLIFVLWFVWKLIKVAIVLIIITIVFVILWYVTPLSEYIPLPM